jgi:membrane protease YdiL (CAAX protease family)
VPPSLPQPLEPPLPPVRWGMGDAAVGYLVANVFSLIAAVAVLSATGYLEDDGSSSDDIPLTLTALLQVPLWLGYFGAPWYAAKYKGNGLVRDFGLRMRWVDVPVGLGIGLATQVGLAIVYAPIARALGIEDVGAAAQELTDKAKDPLGIVLLFLIVAIGAPIIEEIFFRGLVMRSIENRFGTVAAVIGSGIFFGIIHFQPADAPPLIVVGIVLAVLTVRTGRLGPAIWAHVFFNATAATLLVFA